MSASRLPDTVLRSSIPCTEMKAIVDICSPRTRGFLDTVGLPRQACCQGGSVGADKLPSQIKVHYFKEKVH